MPLWLFGMIPYGNGIAVSYKLVDKKMTRFRYIQILDANLNVVRFWEDNSPQLPEEKGIHEPIAIMPDGRFALRGEIGEILFYSMLGTITNRIIFPSVYNETRQVQPEVLSNKGRSYLTAKTAQRILDSNAMIARGLTARLASRDAQIPAPTRLVGPVLPTGIRDFAAMPNADLMLSDGTTNVFRVTPSTGACTLLPISGIDWNAEHEVQSVRIVGANDLFLCTDFTVFHIALTPQAHVVGSADLPDNLKSWPAPWDISSINPATVTFADPFSGQLVVIAIPDSIP
jgi:hypothetical protein